MSVTYVGAVVQFLVMVGVVSVEESQVLSDGALAIMSLVALLVTLYGRFRLGGVSVFGVKQ